MANQSTYLGSDGNQYYTNTGQMVSGSSGAGATPPLTGADAPITSTRGRMLGQTSPADAATTTNPTGAAPALPVATTPIAQKPTPTDRTTGSNEPTAPKAPLNQPIPTPDPLAFSPLPVAGATGDMAPMPPDTAVAPPPTSSPSPRGITPSTPTPTTQGSGAGTFTQTNPADAYYVRNPDGSVRAVSQAEYDQQTAASAANGVVNTFKGTASGPGGTSVYDPVHDRWYDPGLYQSGAQAQENFNEASGPVPWASQVATNLGYGNTASVPTMATQSATGQVTPTPIPSNVTPTPAGTPSTGPTPSTPTPTGSTGTRFPALPSSPSTPSAPPVSVPTPTTAPMPWELPPTAGATLPAPSSAPSPTASVPAPTTPTTSGLSASPSLNGMPATSGALSAVNLTPTTPSNALTNSTITPGPATDRYAIAQQQYDDWQKQTDPQFQAAMRDANRYSAAAGRIGSGQATNSIGDIQTQRENAMRTSRDTFLNNALTGSIDDAYKNIGIAQQQQQFQAGQSNNAFTQQVTLQQLAQSQQGQQFAQTMQALGFNANQIQQAFENAYKTQQLSDDETGQAFYRALQQAMFGAQGDPAQIDQWLAQLYALPQGYTGTSK